MGYNCFGQTDIGLKRNTNQDYFLINQLGDDLTLMIVCDGMGGANGGSIASSLASERFCEYVKENIKNAKPQDYVRILSEALGEANDKVCKEANKIKELEGMGTTLVSSLFDGERYYCICVGDSRIYALNQGKLYQLSHDHSFVQSLVDSGRISENEAKTHPNRNIITKAVGIEENIEGDVFVVESKNLEGLLLCSDGLCGYVEKDEMERICANETDVEKCAQLLIKSANECGGNDNITVIVHKNL